VPIKASAEKTAKLVNGAQLKIYPGGSDRLAQIDSERFNADVLAFMKA
jgi:non-heme chloroperoxidase